MDLSPGGQRAPCRTSVRRGAASCGRTLIDVGPFVWLATGRCVDVILIMGFDFETGVSGVTTEGAVVLRSERRVEARGGVFGLCVAIFLLEHCRGGR